MKKGHLCFLATDWYGERAWVPLDFLSLNTLYAGTKNGM